MDIREQNVSREIADKLSQKAIDPNIELNLDLNRPGERRIFLDTLSRDLIAYMDNLQYCKVTYQNAVRSNSSRNWLNSFFFNESRQEST